MAIKCTALNARFYSGCKMLSTVTNECKLELSANAFFLSPITILLNYGLFFCSFTCFLLFQYIRCYTRFRVAFCILSRIIQLNCSLFKSQIEVDFEMKTRHRIYYINKWNERFYFKQIGNLKANVIPSLNRNSKQLMLLLERPNFHNFDSELKCSTCASISVIT